MFEQVINTTLESFDFSFCISCNILTYLIIKLLEEFAKDHKLSTWKKRIVLLVVILIVSIGYYISGSETKLIINSAILSPVFWSWVAKPILDKLGYGYNNNQQ